MGAVLVNFSSAVCAPQLNMGCALDTAGRPSTATRCATRACALRGECTRRAWTSGSARSRCAACARASARSARPSSPSCRWRASCHPNPDPDLDPNANPDYLSLRPSTAIGLAGGWGQRDCSRAAGGQCSCQGGDLHLPLVQPEAARDLRAALLLPLARHRRRLQRPRPPPLACLRASCHSRQAHVPCSCCAGARRARSRRARPCRAHPCRTRPCRTRPCRMRARARRARLRRAPPCREGAGGVW